MDRSSKPLVKFLPATSTHRNTPGQTKQQRLEQIKGLRFGIINNGTCRGKEEEEIVEMMERRLIDIRINGLRPQISDTPIQNDTTEDKNESQGKDNQHCRNKA